MTDAVAFRRYPQGWVEASPATACGAEYDNDGYSPPSNTTAYCGPHCGPSARVKSFARKTWGYFSAVCMTHGVALLEATGRPQGLLESCWASGKPSPPHTENLPEDAGVDAVAAALCFC